MGLVGDEVMIKNFLLLVCSALLLSGCRSILGRPTPTPFRLFQGPTVVLPTPQPTNLPTTTSTLVMSNPWTPTPAPTITPLPREALGLIAGIVDAETVLVVLQGDAMNQVYPVRLLGVDALPDTPAEPWGIVAVEQLNDWLSGKVVRLVQDTTVVDDEGMLPRYLYLDEDMINLRLIESGLARPSFQSPDTEFESEFEQAARSAESSQRGLWGPPPTATPTRTPTPEGSEPPSATPTPTLAITTTPETTAATPTVLPAVDTTATITATGVITAPIP
jgi:endonuclease YncB( thermonuclease family)